MRCKESGKDKMACEFKDSLKKILSQAMIFIELDGDLKTKWVSKICAFDEFKSLVPRRILGNIKRNLILCYDQRLGIKDGKQISYKI
jgi:hypothetical protein